ncbi:FadR/GntR family transcriptional regulator [Streptomyces mobaraensis]|uniref:GntR family transcriptional regulator n=1 Tax=Streptomyces mobaraensis (strain ATCC 29032 / DSM 40847 / JCM 4168 / NBRC 13819 / NCIMB 11159 / IPCR 16-22) TaxID=1223523 RepID=M3C3R2_STRM1|nr:FadR/GntR family transcriptional regulator [Streptomyces mobaraensis]EME98605.1 GntR family transcriptional regulator [Streptomyces mobaraensis NBRC 13819 = DSM 40847]
MPSDHPERIKRLIVDRRLPPGAPLPTERELTELLGTGRTGVREALKALQAMGIVEIRRGFGTYVGPMTMEPVVEALAFRTVAGHRRGEDSLLQLLELREAVETGLARRLAGHVPAADLAELDAIVARMADEALAGPVGAETDRAFHAVLRRGLDNPLLDTVPEAYWTAFHRVRPGPSATRTDPGAVCARHRAIVTAVRTGDAERTEEAIRDHFCDIRTRLRLDYRFAR